MHLQISLSELQELESRMPMGPTMLEHSTHHSKNNLSYVHSLKQAPTGSKLTLNFHRVEKQNLVLSGVKIWNGLFLDLWQRDSELEKTCAMQMAEAQLDHVEQLAWIPSSLLVNNIRKQVMCLVTNP